MADLVSELASKSGISTDMASKGMGAVLSFLKQRMPADSFAKVAHAVPESEDMMANAEGEQGDAGGGGMLGAVTGLVSKVFGGGAGGAAGLVGKLGQLGFAPDKIQGFLKNALEFLKDKVPGDVLGKLTTLLPSS